MGRLLGIDPGTKRCGVAVTDSAQTMAFPRPAVLVDEDVVAQLAAIVDEEMVEGVVVGRPLSLKGEVTASTMLADQLFGQLQTALAVWVVQSDERLTTTQAQRSFADAGVSTKEARARIDSAAAVIMLEHYVEAHRA
jgi:putative Holliday junction resolvase